MTEINEIYKCNACGKIVQVLHMGIGDLVCCNEKMELLEEQTSDMTVEKHVPIIEKIEHGFRVTVGSTPHPMTDEHYIEWIELIADGKYYRQDLNPGDKAEAEFCIDAKELTAREYCNIHKLWRS